MRKKMAEYIEKKYLLDFLDAVIEAEKEINSRLTARAIQASINVMPSKDVVERKRGKWVRKDSIAHGCVMRVCLCSACKRNALINEDGFWELSNFCPNCGADMRGREDERTD